MDIISDKEIYKLFNNNEQIDKISGKNSNLLIYNFENKSFYKIFKKQLDKINFKTTTQGLVDFNDDGSALIEEQNKGRLVYLNRDGELEWEFINKDDNGDIYIISWSRLIKDKEIIKNLRKKIKNDKC